MTKLFALFACILICTSCGSDPALRITHQQRADIDFNQYRSFYVMNPIAHGQLVMKVRPIIYSKLRKFTQEIMLEKGYHLANERNADILIAVFPNAKHHTQLSQSLNQEVLHIQRPLRYTDGTLIVDIIDQKQQLGIWRGVAEKRFFANDERPDDQDLKNIVKRALQSYPTFTP